MADRSPFHFFWFVVGSGFLLLAALAGKHTSAWLKGHTSEPSLGSSSQASKLVARGLDLGLVWEQTQLDWPITLENKDKGGGNIRVAHFRSSCGCLGVQPASLEIPAGSSRQVKVQLSLQQSRGRKAQASWPIQVQLIAVDGRGEEIATWDITGRVRSALRLESEEVDLGLLFEQGEPFPPKEIRVEEMVELSNVEVQGRTKYVQVRLRRDEKGANSRVEISPGEPLPVGAFSETIELVARDRQGTALPGRKLVVRGRVEPDVGPSQAVVHFGAHQMQEVCSHVLWFQSRSGKTFQVLSCMARGVGLEAEVNRISATVTEITMQQRICADGLQKGSLEIELQFPGHGSRTVRLPVWYYGLR